MIPPTFDTHRALKSLTLAGFSDSQAEAVVETVGVAMDEMLATKTDLQPIRADLAGAIETMVTKKDLEMALQPIRADLDGVMGTMASKTDLAALEQRMTIKLGAMVFASMSFLAVLQ